MKPINIYAILTLMFLYNTDAHALTFKEIKIAAIEVCRGGLVSGQESNLLITGDANGKAVLIKKLVELGVNGNIKFSNKEWEGIEVIKNNDSVSHTECVKEIFPLLLKNLDPPKPPKPDEFSFNIINDSFIKESFDNNKKSVIFISYEALPSFSSKKTCGVDIVIKYFNQHGSTKNSKERKKYIEIEFNNGVKVVKDEKVLLPLSVSIDNIISLKKVCTVG